MNKSIVAIVVAGLVTLTTFAAEAKKARVCEAWFPYASTVKSDLAPKNVFVCVDNEDKPYMMINPNVVEVKKDGDIHRLLVEVSASK